MTRHRVNLLEGPVGSTLLRLAGPMSLGLVAVILFNVVDTFWVGRLGARELTAISYTFPVFFFLLSISIGMGAGVTAVVSRVIGEGDTHRVVRHTTDGLILANTLVVVLAVAGLLTIDPMFRALGASPDMIQLIRQYMVPLYIGIGFIVIPIVGNAAIRATGDTKTPSVIMIIAGGMNMILDPLLIFGVGPFPRLELRGAAIATVAGYAITFFAAGLILWKRERMIDFSRPRVREVLDSWRRILYIGGPTAATQMLVPLGAGILTRIASEIGPEAVAGFGVGTRIESLSMIGAMALSASMTPFVGQNLGAQNPGRVRTAVRFAMGACLVYGAVIATGLAALAHVLASLFTIDAAVVEVIERYLYIIPASYGLYGMMFAFNAAFNAAHKPMKSALTISVRLFVLAVPLAYLGSKVAGVPGLFFGVCAANVVVGIIAAFIGRRFIAVGELANARPQASA